MSALIKSGLANQQSSCFQLRSAFFHSTPLLERGRRNYWNSRYNNGNNNRRSRRNPFRQNILRDINAYAEYLLHNLQSGFDHEEEPSSKGPSWFRRPDSGSRRSWTNDQRRQNMRRRGFNFCDDDDDDDEAPFRSAFGDRFFFWSFVDQDYPNWRTSSRYSNRHNTSWKRRHQSEDEYEYTSEEDSPKSDLASERTALGLDASGPLKLEDVKNAYRACALKWHPDRHQGSSKTAAEEKFKLCTAAYQSLCDRLPVN